MNCGNEVTRYGYKISWDIKELDVGEEYDERYFCSIDCVERWLNNLGFTGREEVINTDDLDFHQIAEN